MFLDTLIKAVETALASPRGARIYIADPKAFTFATNKLAKLIKEYKYPLVLMTCPYDSKEVWLIKSLMTDEARKEANKSFPEDSGRRLANLDAILSNGEILGSGEELDQLTREEIARKSKTKGST